MDPDLPLDDLHPDVEAQVRALLAEAAVPAMPLDVEARVRAALDAERGRDRAAEVPGLPRRLPASRHDLHPPLAARARRSRPLLAAAAVAAAVAVVGGGLGALQLANRPSGSAVAVVAAPSGTSSGTAPPEPVSTGPRSTGPRIHIQLSRTAYDASTLAASARALLSHPGTPILEGAAESPSLGPIATEIGLTSCLGALGAASADAVSADLATYAGEPAAVLVVTTAGKSTAYAVRRQCTMGDPQLLQGPTPVR